jgi:hypothetical protein
MHIEDIKSKYHYFFTDSTVFFCGQGWVKILDQLFDQIAAYILTTENNYKSDLHYNQMVEKCQQENWVEFDRYYYNWDERSKEKFKNKILTQGVRIIKPICPALTIDKIDEHAGSLTISYRGGDQITQGMILLAKAMSQITCEKCGHPGFTRGQGWKYTSCDDHVHEPNLKFFED